MKKIFYTLLLLFVFFFGVNKVSANESNYVYLGGETVGFNFKSNVTIVKTFGIASSNDVVKPWSDAGIKENDIIVKYNDNVINTKEDLISALKNTKNNDEITILRNGILSTHNIKPYYSDGSYSLGIYVKDNIIGIGTITFIVPETLKFGSLGHSIDSLGNEIQGELLEARVTGINKSYCGSAGSKRATISDEKIGYLEKNIDIGVYGKYSGSVLEKRKIEIGFKEEAKLGKALIYTCIDGYKPDYYEIEIISLENQTKKDLKGIKFIVTDNRIIDKCGGVVQGMSGSPIIQNDKIIGAVTHVVISNPKEGFGVYIEFMIDEAK